MNTKRMLAALLALALVAAACGDDDGGADDGGGGDEGGCQSIIRFTFAPDPVWDYLNDSGVKDEMEQESGICILAQVTWDEFGIYAGGFADIVSVGDFEVPTLDKQAETTSVVFGKYNIDRSVLAVPASDTTSQSLEDLAGKRIAVWDSVSSTLIWGVIAQEIHGLDFRTGGGDFELVQVDITNTGPTAAAGEVDGALVLPDFAVNELINDEIRVLYDGQTSAELYADEIAGNPGHEGPMINVFLAGEEWYDDNPDEIDFFMRMWQRGIDEWQANKAEIIASYPQHFAVEGDEQVQFMQGWLDEHDWFVTTVYLDDAWLDAETPLFDIMRENGFMESDEENPRFEVLTP
ncbi:MAG TPA: ABC transporter substrate-binding protein [Acidimicrobiia bacterium]|nr:ABC transporter substrate-binding protein [Acidimicrobiia bacterium]